MDTTTAVDPRSGLIGSRPTISLGAGGGAFERLVSSTGLWSRDLEQGSGLEISPGAISNPIPVMMGIGANPELMARWSELWEWLKLRRKTREDQQARLQAIADLLREQAEDQYPDPKIVLEREAKLLGLRRACISPFISEEGRHLFACQTDIGLLFVYDHPSKFRPALHLNPRVPLVRVGNSRYCNMGEAYDLVILNSAALPLHQLLPWGEAAEHHGWLFSLLETRPK